MSPVTKLLVYYIKSDLETVADSISLFVANRLENRISVRFSANETMPGEMTRLQIEASANQVICISVTDRALELIHKTQNDEEKIFEAINEYSSVKDKDWWGFDAQHFWGLQTRDSEYAFRDAGKILGTNSPPLLLTRYIKIRGYLTVINALTVRSMHHLVIK